MSSTSDRVTVHVRNDGHNPVERAGHVFRPRRTRTVVVSQRRLAEISACRQLRVVDDPPPDVDAAAGDDQSGQQGGGQSEPAPAGEPEPNDGLEKKTVAKLRTIAKAEDVPTGGKKAELIAAIRAARSAPDTDAGGDGDGGDGE